MNSESRNQETKPTTPQEPLEIKPVNGNIVLRQFIPDDAREIFDLIDRNRGHLSQFGDDTAQKYPTYESVLSSITNPKNPARMRFGIRKTEDGGELTGSINLTPDADNIQRGEIGYYMGSEYQDKGFGTEAVRALCQFAFGELGYVELYAKVHPDNKASQRVLIKTGFVQTGMKDADVIFSRLKQITLKPTPGLVKL